MKRTEFRRKMRRISDDILADAEDAAQAELNWLYRQLQYKVRRINQFRPRTGMAKSELSKYVIPQGDLWEMFRMRMQNALIKKLLSGAIALASLYNEYYALEQPIEINSDEFARQLEPEIGERITRVSNSIKRQVGRQVVGWYNTPGMTMNTLVGQMQSTFGRSRAALIAQNEVTSLNSGVNELIAQRTGLGEWWWSTRRDQIVCKKPLKGPDGKIYQGCRELHGKVFKVGMPMPPKGSHIGCILPGQEVSVPGLSAATKSFYKGVVIEIFTASGHNLTVTPNHPILTSEGFIQAKFVHKGTNVITHTLPKRIASCINPNYKHVPTIVENIFSSLKMTKGMDTAIVPTSPINFYGDARFFNGNVDIVFTNRNLSIKDNSSFDKPICQINLNRGGHRFCNISAFGLHKSFFIRWTTAFRGAMSRMDLIFSLFLAHLRPLQFFRFALSSDMNMIENQNLSNNCPTGFKFFSSTIFRIPVLVEINDFFHRIIMPFKRFLNLNVVQFQNISNSNVSNPILTLNFLDRESRFIKQDNVVDVNRRYYSGHVYDLQSDLYALYTCNGVIVSNCRCDAVLIVPEPKVETATTSNIARALVQKLHKDYDPNEARDESGKWTSGVGGIKDTHHVEFQSGTKKISRDFKIHHNPDAFHGTYSDAVDSIKHNGFKISESGTAGPGVYLTFNEKDALYEKDPNRSRAVQQHGGKQPDITMPVKINGDILHVGQMEEEGGPSMYLRPQIYAAYALSATSGENRSVGDFIQHPELAAQVIQQHGYSGVSWNFVDGRHAAVVFDPKNIDTGKSTLSAPNEDALGKAIASQGLIEIMQKDFDPNEPRDAKGEWTAGAGSAKKPDIGKPGRAAIKELPFKAELVSFDEEHHEKGVIY